MIEFVCIPLPVRIVQQGCHSNYAFSHSPNELLFRNIFLIQGGGGAGNNLAPMKNCQGGCKVCQIRLCGIGYPILVLI